MATVANHLHDTAENAIARARHEYTTAADDPAVIQRRRGAGGIGEALVAAPQLPQWLPDLDAAWQQLRADLIMATRAAAAAMTRTGSSYRDLDDRLDVGLGDLDSRGDGPATLGATALNRAAVDPGAATAVMDAAMDTVLPGTTGNSSGDDRDSLEFAIAVWSERSRSTNNTVHAVTDLVTALPGWTGPAADAYTDWLHTHRDHWEGLHEDATRIRDALAAHDTPNTSATGPTTAPAGLSPADLFHYSDGRGLVPGDTTPPTTTPDAAASSDGHPDGRELLAMAPVMPLPTTATMAAPAAAPSAPAVPDPTPDTAVSAASVEPIPPHWLPDTAAPNRIRLADGESDPARSDDVHDSNDDPPGQPDMLTTNPGLAAALLGGGLAGGAATMAAIGAARPARVLQVVPPIGHDTPDGPLVPHPDATATPAPTHRPGVPATNGPGNPPGSADAPAVPWTGTAPPPSTTTPSAPPPVAGGGTMAPPPLTSPSPSPGTGGAVSGGRTGLGPDSIGAVLDAVTTFPGRDTSHHGVATAEHRNHRHHEDRATLDAATGRERGLLLDIGIVGRDPVWLDLAAIAGVGLTGPGAAAVTRTVLRLLLTYHRPVRVTAHFNTLAALLDDNTAPHYQPHDPAADAAPSPAAVGHPWLSLAARSFDILDAAHTGIDRRRGQPAHQPDPISAIGEHAGPAAPGSDAPWVMLVPAPTSARARQRLDEVLDTGRRYGITAVLLGPCDTGTTLHIDHDHYVIHHHIADTGDTGAHGSLNGAQLRTTRPVELGRLIAAGAGELDPGFLPPENSTQPRTDPPTEPSSTPPPPPAPRDLAQARTIRTEPIASTAAAPPTAATLTVFGQTCLRYRNPSDIDPAAVPDSPADTTAPDTVPVIEEFSEDSDGRIVEGLGPRATELLLFLAVHPGGASRDYLVATLWPDAAGDRPSGPFYNLLARLRRTLHTATGGHDLDELIVRTGDRYRLNLDLVATDYTTFLHAATDINHPDPTIRARACETVIHTYRGALGRDHTSSEWLLELQLNARYRYLCALTSLAQLTLHTDPDRTLGLLETARLHEPTNEDIYRSIMTIHDHQHRPDAALNTYALLQAHLDNLDNTLAPEPATTALALRIRDTHTQQLRRSAPPRSA